jgi:hypothetical protein
MEARPPPARPRRADRRAVAARGLESHSVAPTLVDHTTSPVGGDQQPADALNGAHPALAPAADAPAAPSAGSVPAHTPEQTGGSCANCGAALAPGQDWCLQCGAGAPGSIGSPNWRSAALVLGATAVLVLGAVAAAYAALTKEKPAPRTVTTTVAQVTPTTPTTSTPTFTPPATTTTPTVALPKTTIPKIPITPTVTPKSTTTTPTNTTTTPGNTTSTQTSTTPATTGGSTPEPEAIVLDTNAASTYNPYEFPATNFGDPSLTIDGDTSTAWTAQVNAATAPSMAEGVLIDLKAQQKVASMKLVTSTPGMTVQAYGTTDKTAPTTITDPAWIALNGPRLLKKSHVKMKLHDSSKAFYYVLLWISKAPSTSTPAAPGHVSVNEIELLPTQ